MLGVGPFFWIKRIKLFVVSRILRVHESLGHEPDGKHLQNKQGTDDGVQVGYPMLKLVKEIGSVLTINSAIIYFHIPSS